MLSKACLRAGALMPHEFIQITRYLVGMTSFHPLEFHFNSLPVGLDMLGVYIGNGVNKGDRMINSPMRGHRW